MPNAALHLSSTVKLGPLVQDYRTPVLPLFRVSCVLLSRNACERGSFSPRCYVTGREGPELIKTNDTSALSLNWSVTKGQTVFQGFHFHTAGSMQLNIVRYVQALSVNISFLILRFVIMATQHTIWPTEINIAQLQSKQRKRASLVEQIPDETAGGSVLLQGGLRVGCRYTQSLLNLVSRALVTLVQRYESLVLTKRITGSRNNIFLPDYFRIIALTRPSAHLICASKLWKDGIKQTFVQAT